MTPEIIAAVVTGLAAIVAAVITIAPHVLKRRKQGRDELREAPPSPGPASSPRVSSPSTGRPAEPPGKLGREEVRKEVVNLLDRYHQRATYGAVAGVVGGIARSVMSGLPREPRYSWVVSSNPPHHPSRYSEAEMHPQLEERAHVITTAEELRIWLRNPQ